MSAGPGILHSEKNDSWRLTGEPQHENAVHFVQMWVLPDESGIKPGYEQLDIGDQVNKGGLVVVASGMERYADQSAISIANRHAALHVARLNADESVNLPTAPFVHVYVARGSVELEGAGALVKGDAARITASEAQHVTASEDAEVLVWEMHSGLAA